MNEPLKPVFKSSPQSTIKLVKLGTPKYPWSLIQPGFSFIINPSEMKLATAKSFASRMQKKHGRKFRVIDHGPDVGYEVACIAMSEPDALAVATNIPDLLDKTGGAVASIVDEVSDIERSKKAMEEHLAKQGGWIK